MHFEKVVCRTIFSLTGGEIEIPPPRRFPFMMTVQVGNDRQLFSNQKVLTILDTQQGMYISGVFAFIGILYCSLYNYKNENFDDGLFLIVFDHLVNVL